MADETTECRWFVLHTYFGREKKVCELIKEQAEITGRSNLIKRIVVPLEKEMKTKTKDGKEIKVEVEKTSISGYVLIQMVPDNALIDDISKVTGVTGFLGSDFKLTPASDEEVKRFLKEDKRKPRKSRTVLEIRPGDEVNINDGIFKGSKGIIESLDFEHDKIIVRIDVFGRPTPTEFFVHQVEKISK
ncbi:MAG: transcription termination/antitermination protein NusG [Candidatus Sumerlaeales bacterium]|nr:transcription termination/antitermination protein NusG [Candidatus Sumerlaeales bacterium]